MPETPINTEGIYREAVRKDARGEKLTPFERLGLIMFEHFSSEALGTKAAPCESIKGIQNLPGMPHIYRRDTNSLVEAMNAYSNVTLFVRCYNDGEVTGYQITKKLLEITLGERANA